MAVPILHVSQLAAALGLPRPDGPAGARLAVDTADLLRAWLDQLRPLPLTLLLEATPSRGRSLRNLTVNVFHPFALLPGAWAGEGFPWHPEKDELLEEPLRTAGDVVGYADSIYESWSSFLEDAGDLERPGLQLPSPRGVLSWHDLLDHQRWHAAFHYRQLVAFLDARNVARPASSPARAPRRPRTPGRGLLARRRRLDVAVADRGGAYVVRGISGSPASIRSTPPRPQCVRPSAVSSVGTPRTPAASASARIPRICA